MVCSSASLRPSPERRLQQRRDRRLADPAEAERGHGDAELAGREIGLELVEHAQRQAGGAAALLGQALDADAAHLDHSELGGDEEGVRRQQQNDGDRVEHG